MTSDGVILAGAVVEPKGKKKAALIWIHGLTSSYDGGQELMNQLSRACVQQGIGYFKFNTRGHGVVKGGKPMQGAALEKFTACIKDIEAVIALAKKRGYNKFILAGHSTGANKVAYYMHKLKPRNVVGVILTGPVSDIVGQYKLIGKKRLEVFVKKVTTIAKRTPRKLIETHGQLFSAERIVSLFTPGKPEDTFPWYNPKARWTAVSSIKTPALVVFGEKDNYLDRPVDEVLEIFWSKTRSAKTFTGLSIPGASHGFHEHQGELVKAVSVWLKKTV